MLNAKLKILIPMLITLLSGILMISTLAMPYLSADADLREEIDETEGGIEAVVDFFGIENDTDVELDDFKSISILKFNKFAKGTEIAILPLVIIILVGGFSALMILLAILKKPIGVMVFGILATLIYAVINTVLNNVEEFEEIFEHGYNKGAAFTVPYIALILAFVGGIWLIVAKSQAKKAAQNG